MNWVQIDSPVGSSHSACEENFHEDFYVLPEGWASEAIDLSQSPRALILVRWKLDLPQEPLTWPSDLFHTTAKNQMEIGH